jgi:hypothetical protein
MRKVFGTGVHTLLGVVAVAVTLVAFAPVASGARPTATATSPSPACSAPGQSRAEGHFLGVARPQGQGANKKACPTPGNAPAPVGTEAPYNTGGTPPLLNHNGPVMSTDPLGGQITITPIYWVPSSHTMSASYQGVINTYLTDIAADSGKSTNVFSVGTQYTDSAGNPIRYKFVAGAPILDSTPFPVTGGCTPDTGGVYADGTGYTACVDDAQLATELHNVVTSKNLVSDQAHMYQVFLPQGVESCFTSANGAAAGQCTLNSHAATAGGYCAYHSSTGSTIYSAMPFAIYHSPTGYTCSPEGGPGIQSPNGDINADIEVSPLSHEITETNTDPFGTAWYDSSGNENGDDCAYIFGGSFGGTAGAQYNQTINSHHYFTQEEFSNANFVANTSGCLQSLAPKTTATATTTTVSASATPSVGAKASLTAAVGPTVDGGTVRFTDNNATIGCDAVTLTNSTATCAVTFTTAGTHPIKAVYSGDATFAGSAGTQNVTVNPVVPGAPIIGKATAGTRSVRVAFTPPRSNGGAPITSYTVTASNGKTATGTASPITVTGLTSGQAYTFTVTATNSAGTSPASAASNRVAAR